MKGKVAIVTGGSKGIGLQTAIELAKEGAQPVLVARNITSLNEAKEKVFLTTGIEPLVISADVSKTDDCKKIISTVVERYSKIDILINNAGTAAALSFEDTTTEGWKSDLDLKLMGAVNCSKLALPYLKKNGGSIVNVTAVMAKTPPPNSLPSTVSRAAGLALTKAMSKDLGKYNIRVNAVCIGLIRSDQIEGQWKGTSPELSWEEYSKEVGQSIPLGRIGDTHEAAKTIAFLASDAASYVSGTSINIDGGLGGAL